ncbi:MAG TPA: hypothetical protein VFC19_14460 [Candidatus Limnocylindrales bacterium]|nr:hypothetical protein [Candidatus Limnocylindrales bacterium]
MTVATAVTVAAMLAACDGTGGGGSEGVPAPAAVTGCGPAKVMKTLRGDAICVASTDSDQDGTPDEFEDLILQRYRPYLRFSVDDGEETFRPTDALWYLARSDLIVSGDEDSEVVLSHQQLAGHYERLLAADHKNLLVSRLGPTDLTRNPRRTDWHINPLGDDTRRGPEWDVVMRKQNTGLYGHVLELRTGEYQVEYWQFFGYSSVNRAFDIADHEGDWTCVSLIVQPGDPEHELLSVTHRAHGYPLTFHFPSRRSVDPVPVSGGAIKEYRGGNYDTDFDLRGNKTFHSDNAVRMFRTDEPGALFLHPVVFVERGAHEFWPTENGSIIGAPKHNGVGRYRYLVGTVPNLGEVDHPLDTRARVILHYNGLWGAYSRSVPGIIDTTPPQGPALHTGWVWPRDSALRRRIGSESFGG